LDIDAAGFAFLELADRDELSLLESTLSHKYQAVQQIRYRIFCRHAQKKVTDLAGLHRVFSTLPYRWEKSNVLRWITNPIFEYFRPKEEHNYKIK